MLETITIIETVLLGFSGIILCASLFKVLSAPKEENYSPITAVFFTIMLATTVIALRLIWI